MGPFKECTSCNTIWQTRDEFLNDSNVVIVGYQVSFKDIEKGLFLFNHSCKSTIAVEVHAFADLYDGPIYQERATGGEDCPGLCLHKNKLGPCPARCECAYAREILQLLKQS